MNIPRREDRFQIPYHVRFGAPDIRDHRSRPDVGKNLLGQRPHLADRRTQYDQIRIADRSLGIRRRRVYNPPLQRLQLGFRPANDARDYDIGRVSAQSQSQGSSQEPHADQGDTLKLHGRD